tara:strand:- start:709 stop:1131 length:423 start_codon:yes stop_codon:yes gene_type:complete
MEKIKVFEKDIKVNKKGNVLKYLEINKNFPKISEVYFSFIKRKNVKAWKKNITSNQFLYVIKGKIKFIIFDDRLKKKYIKKYLLGSSMKYSKIFIPKDVWYGFEGLTDENIIVNALNFKHKKCKMITLNYKNDYIPFNWN